MELFLAISLSSYVYFAWIPIQMSLQSQKHAHCCWEKVDKRMLCGRECCFFATDDSTLQSRSEQELIILQMTAKVFWKTVL